MEKPWKIHGKKSMDSLENHEVRTKFHGFHGDISILSMLAPDRKIVRIVLMNAWEAWDIEPWKAMENMGIYKNESMESMESMVFSSILL